MIWEPKADDLRAGSSLLSKKETFTINPGEHLEKDLTFAGSVTLLGKVIDPGTNQPVPHMGLRLLISTGQRYLDTKDVTVDANGCFSVNVAPGSEVQFSWEESRRKGLYLMDEAWKQQGNYNPSFRQVVNEDVTDLDLKINDSTVSGARCDPKTLSLLEQGKLDEVLTEYRTGCLASIKKLYSEAAIPIPFDSPRPRPGVCGSRSSMCCL